MPNLRRLVPAIALYASLVSPALAADPPGRITSVGGIFFKRKDLKTLMAWYRHVLGTEVEAQGRRGDAPGHPPAVIVSAFG